MTGAILTWGAGSAAVDDLIRVCRRHKIQRVLDVRPPRRLPAWAKRIEVGPQNFAWLTKRKTVIYERRDDIFPAPNPVAVGRLYHDARNGQRVLILAQQPDPRRCHRHASLLLPIAQDAARYAESALAGVVTPIELGHIVDGKVVGPLELEAEASAAVAKRGKAKRRGS